jgi:tRNA pseudouridine38-40 synthase
MATYRLTVEYEGTRYHGWQEQRNARTVAGELRAAAAGAGAKVLDLGGSGRTDAGVHALAQAAHLRLAAPIDASSFRREINDRLPPDIHVLALAPAPDTFHSRHAAISRSYLYQVARRRTAFAKRFVWWVREPLDVARLSAAAAAIPGRHDFALFCERPVEQTSTLVVVERVEVVEAGALILIRIVASHFLWKMVRRLVGTMVRAGTGDLQPADLKRLLAATSLPPGRGAPGEWTAPPSGLFLERVIYPGEPGLLAAVPVSPVAAEESQAARAATAAPAPGVRRRQPDVARREMERRRALPRRPKRRG